MKTKQSLKWHPDSILDLINLPRLMLHRGHLKYLISFHFNKAMIL